MTNKTKTAAGVSVITVAAILWHIAEVTNALTEFNERSAENIQHSTSTIILRDSTGRTDTMDLGEYLKIQEEQ